MICANIEYLELQKPRRNIDTALYVGSNMSIPIRNILRIRKNKLKQYPEWIQTNSKRIVGPDLCIANCDHWGILMFGEVIPTLAVSTSISSICVVFGSVLEPRKVQNQETHKKTQFHKHMSAS